MMQTFKEKFRRMLTEPHGIRKAFVHIFARFYDDRTFLERMYFFKMGKKLNLDSPQTFNEKMQWLKLHDRKPEYTAMVDKFAAKEYVAGVIGQEHIIPTIGVWDRPEDIDWESLPQQFVLKVTHDSGGLVVCTDKSSLDKEAAVRQLRSALKTDYYIGSREWPYKDVPKRIIAEQYIGDNLTDYKVMCFGYSRKVILVCRDRFSSSGLTEDFFDEQWNHLDVKRPDHPNAAKAIERPSELEEMLALADKLSVGIPFIRVDFYTANGKVYFGELTLYPASGMTPFVPDSIDKEWGGWITLPE